MNNPFLKYVMKSKKEDIFHSSAYGKAQGGCNMGATSAETFNKRREMEKNRQNVSSYQNSAIMGGTMRNGPRAKSYTPPTKK